MKKVTNLKHNLTTPSACGRHPFKFFPKTLRFLTTFGMTKGNFSRFSFLTVLRSYGLTVLLLSVFAIANAQVDEKGIVGTDFVQNNELRITQKIAENVTAVIQNQPDDFLALYGITNRVQLENLHIGKPVPAYRFNDDNESLEFTDYWFVPVFSDEDSLLFKMVTHKELLGYSFENAQRTKLVWRRIYNSGYKDFIDGYLRFSSGMEYIMIRKESIDIFVQVYDKVTKDFFQNEFSFSELANLFKEQLKAKRHLNYDKFVGKSELKITPEIEEMIFRRFRNKSEKFYPYCGIKDRSQLDNLELGKPIPKYGYQNDSLLFIGKWEVPVMSDGVPFDLVTIKLMEDGQYKYEGGGPGMAEAIYKYEYKDLIIGFLGVESPLGMDYLIIRKNGKDIFVKTYDWETRESFKTEYSLQDIIKLNKK